MTQPKEGAGARATVRQGIQITEGLRISWPVAVVLGLLFAGAVAAVWPHALAIFGDFLEFLKRHTPGS